MAVGYFRTVLNIGAQLFTMVLLVGIGKSFLDAYYSNMNSGILLGELGVMLVVSVVLLALVNKLPALVGGLAMGGGTGTLGSGYGAGSAAAATVMGAAAVATAGAALAAGAASVGGGAQALMAAFSKAAAAENAGAADSIPSGDAAGSGGRNNGDPLASAMGDMPNQGARVGKASERPSQSTRPPAGGQAKSASAGGPGKIGRVAAGTLSNLGKGALDVAKGSVISLQKSASHRMENTLGGKIAKAINARAPTEQAGTAPAAANKSNSLSTGSRAGVDAAAEVAAFRDRDHRHDE